MKIDLSPKEFRYLIKFITLGNHMATFSFKLKTEKYEPFILRLYKQYKMTFNEKCEHENFAQCDTSFRAIWEHHFNEKLEKIVKSYNRNNLDTELPSYFTEQMLKIKPNKDGKFTDNEQHKIFGAENVINEELIKRGGVKSLVFEIKNFEKQVEKQAKELRKFKSKCIEFAEQHKGLTREEIEVKIKEMDLVVNND